MRLLFLLTFFILPFQMFSENLGDIPVESFGRFRKLNVHAKLWTERLGIIPPKNNALRFIWNLHFFGPKHFEDEPLFKIDLSLRTSLNLPKVASANQIEKAFSKGTEDTEFLRDKLALFRLGAPIKALPQKRALGSWKSLKPLSEVNFTPYSNASYQKIMHILKEPINQASEVELAQILIQNYRFLEGKAYSKALHNQLTFPSIWQLSVEEILQKYPWVMLTAICYLIAALMLSIPLKKLTFLGFTLCVLAFIAHTLFLGLRCYVLERPPVTNMYETMVYVPWIAMGIAFFFYFLHKIKNYLLAGSIGSGIVLLLLSAGSLDGTLENVQPVLNSQFWLSIHVLMVVGSYGAFILSAVLAHFYLISPKTKLSHAVLQSLLIGTALLICGTILGGVWAAQSWGRFWDWDPKESWAFISSSLYLIILHAYRFGKIGPFGLSVGSILGLQAIIFTWYGVNFLLGTGLHSYGFGSGGQMYYGLFVAVEMLFLLSICLLQRQKTLKKT